MNAAPRTVCWFSCGAPSAVAAKLASAERDVIIAYCEVREEHPDNQRFLRDCEKWFGQEVLVLGNDEYDRSIYEVFRKTRFLVGPKGARCTTELKRNVRKEFQEPDDVLVMGYTVEEQDRLDRFNEQNAECHELWPILIEKQLTKADCKAMVQRAGIKLPRMYELGYRNNNCVGCVKGQAGYWNKIHDDFPDDSEVGFHPFGRMAATERDLGRTICKREWVEDGKRQLERIYLDQLPADLGRYPQEADIECGIFCHAAETIIGDSNHGRTKEQFVTRQDNDTQGHARPEQGRHRDVQRQPKRQALSDARGS